MGIWDTITDLVEAATPWSVVEAEAPAQEEQVRALFFVITASGIRASRHWIQFSWGKLLLVFDMIGFFLWV